MVELTSYVTKVSGVTMSGSIVLITGGNGFLGQHIVKELQERDSSVSEIRIVDLDKFVNKIGFKETIPIRDYVRDVTNMDSLSGAFEGVSCVFHCAAHVSYEYPSDDETINKTNIEGTRNVIDQCLKHGVRNLIYTSTTEVCMKPYFRNGYFSIIINQTESKAVPPEDSSQFIFGSYAESKLKAEKLVLSADNTPFPSGDGSLRTLALRPTFMYGEGDAGLITSLLSLGNHCDRTFYRVAGHAGRHQLSYVGNVAYAHICAKNSLNEDPESIGGLPVFITDDTRVDDVLWFCKKMTRAQEGQESSYRTSWWYIPGWLGFLFALFLDSIQFLLLFPLLGKRFPFSLRTLVAFLCSMVLFNRLRSTLYLSYSPVYSAEESLKRARTYYCSLYSRPKFVQKE